MTLTDGNIRASVALRTLRATGMRAVPSQVQAGTPNPPQLGRHFFEPERARSC